MPGNTASLRVPDAVANTPPATALPIAEMLMLAGCEAPIAMRFKHRAVIPCAPWTDEHPPSLAGLGSTGIPTRM